MKSVHKMMLVPYEEGLDKPKNKGLEKELIVSAMPKSLKRKADSLLSYIQGSIEWKNNGEVVYNNKCLEGSHITDLPAGNRISKRNQIDTGQDIRN